MRPTAGAGLELTALGFLVLWILGVFASVTLGGFLHVLLVFALGTMLVRVLRGREGCV